jgi:single-strand DNA-binding protein
MSNNISFIGRIGNDPELKQVGQNDILELNVANNVGFGDRRSTNWFRCSIWGKRAVSLQPHLSKGKEVFVTGQLTLREYTNRDGEKRISADIKVGEIEFVGGNREQSQASSSEYSNSSAPANSRPAASAQSTPETDDDMPF